jgi:hypothetical protein
MELNKQLQAEITDIFRGVQYGRIIFYLNPEANTLDYTVETKSKLQIGQKTRRSNDKNINLTENFRTKSFRA